jgi:oligopeptide transport system ATP-binding protein
MSTPVSPQSPLLEIRGLVKHFRAGRKAGRPVSVRAVDGVDLTIGHGEVLGLVGESGCGKSTVARMVARLHTPDAGEILVNGQDFAHVSGSGLRDYRRVVQMTFQDPYSSLDPRKSVGDSIAEPLRSLAPYRRDRRKVEARVQDLLDMVHLSKAHSPRYPHELSGGQRQRVGVARALALEPKLVVLDEPLSALDVSVQAGLINLLADLRAQAGVSYLFIAHDLSVVRHISDRVAVMYLGRVVEAGTVSDVFDNPLHPYTQALLSSVPAEHPANRGGTARIRLTGDLPAPTEKPSGCRFRSRCFRPQAECAETPDFRVRGNQSHPTACHFSGSGTAG